MTRQTMGPPASEPEQRDYAITITAPDGTTTSAGIVRSHHALDAAREAATTRGLGALLGESAVSGAWAVSTASGHVVRAEAVFGQARAIPRRSSPSNDERAATQRMIADAIRLADRSEVIIATASIYDAADRSLRGALVSSYQARELAALAACAADPAILDAVNQVATVNRLERG